MTDFRLATPAEWGRIPLEDARTDAAISRICSRRFKNVVGSQHVRGELERLLRKQAYAARDAGGLDLYVSELMVGPVPLASSLIVSSLDVPADLPSSDVWRALAGRLGGDDATRSDPAVDMTSLPAGPAIRRSFTRSRGGAAADGGMEAPDAFCVEWYLLDPNSARILLLSFSTIVVALKEGFLDLFDAVASTVSWVVDSDAAPVRGDRS